jgi:hypothetical protein
VDRARSKLSGPALGGNVGLLLGASGSCYRGKSTARRMVDCSQRGLASSYLLAALHKFPGRYWSAHECDASRNATIVNVPLGTKCL